MESSRSNKPLVFFVSVLVLTLVAVFLLVRQCSGVEPTDTAGETTPDKQKAASDGDSIALTVDGKHVDDDSTARTGTPEELVGRVRDLVVNANDSGDVKPLLDFLGKNALTPSQARQLRKLTAESRLKLNPREPISAVQNAADRWALNLADHQRILLDLAKNAEGAWSIDRVTLPGESGAVAGGGGKGPATPDDEAKAAAAVKGFMNAILKLDPTSARQYVDPEKVNYAKLAGLCIIFEEGKYKPVKEQAVRKMFLNANSAGWITRVESAGARENAMFAISTKRKDADSPWKITEINLDKLLADYAGRFSDGDIYYIPLIKNPKGGDSLAIYFDLDSEELTVRTKRQLGIVADLLKKDTAKKLTISGHTDALGTREHNLTLSEQRARKVMQFLTKQGVDAAQMEVIGYGKSKPRRPNTTADGRDAPDGRRANRRAEILLNF